jgi:hypothetical protein
MHRRLLANNGLTMACRRRRAASARASLPLSAAQDPGSAMLAEHQAVVQMQAAEGMAAFWRYAEGPVESRQKAPLAEVVQHIVAKTDGVPLYVEELTEMLLTSGLLREEGDQYVLTGPLRTMAIPDTLQDALMTRLDQLNRAKEVTQLGAVLGREFAYELLQAIAPQDEDTLQAGLAQVVTAELLYQRGRPPRARYVFKHALIQDAAYASF